ncbi:MAG: hypothetical protein K2P76_16350 [Lachnospiraceae bacterium]|jgi:hypothetical protein|nr:hypothetical protein [Lachnospiraceae bacterium]
MKPKKKRGRPMSSHNVSVTPEFREEPDIEKLGRVLIAIALDNAKRKEAVNEAAVLTEPQATISFPENRKGDAMT